jgi:2-methylcitrate dehydratase PrpD
MNFITDYRLEKYILDTKWGNLPEEVQIRARVCTLDLVMALILGSHGRQFKAGKELARTLYKDGDIPVVGSKETFSVMGAVVAMGHASNSFDIDDGHVLVCGHPGTSFIAGLMAAALDKNIDYKEFLTTMVVAYDTAVRNGLAVQKHYNYLHSTGAYGAVATCAAMSRIFGLNYKQLNNAISIADFHAPLTPVMRSVEYPSMNKDGVPFGALVGAMAVYETLAGETGKKHILELDECNHYLDTLGDVYECMNIYFKPYTSCRWAHQPIAAVIDLKNTYNIEHVDVEFIKVHTYEAAARLSKIVPNTTDEAQYNIAYPVAAAMVHGDVGYEQVVEEALDDSRVLDMMKRLSFVVDPAMEEGFPAKRLAWVEIGLKNGEILKSSVYAADGEASDNIGKEWISKKFKRITRPFIAPDAQERLIKLFLEGELNTPIKALVEEVNNSINRL